MTVYSEASLRALQDRVSSYRSEEAYITFYLESDYAGDATPRSTMTPLGTYLFYLGISVDETNQLLTPQQAVGSRYKNLKPVGYTETKLTVSGLYTQEGADLDWLVPGGPGMLVYLDFIDESRLNPGLSGNALDAYGRIVETWVIRDARTTDKRISYQDAASVQFSVSFSALDAIHIPLNATQEEETIAIGTVLSSGGTSGGGGTSTPGFGSIFGANFGG